MTFLSFGNTSTAKSYASHSLENQVASAASSQCSSQSDAIVSKTKIRLGSGSTLEGSANIGASAKNSMDCAMNTVLDTSALLSSKMSGTAQAAQQSELLGILSGGNEVNASATNITNARNSVSSSVANKCGGVARAQIVDSKVILNKGATIEGDINIQATSEQNVKCAMDTFQKTQGDVEVSTESCAETRGAGLFQNLFGTAACGTATFDTTTIVTVVGVIGGVFGLLLVMMIIGAMGAFACKPRPGDVEDRCENFRQIRDMAKQLLWIFAFLMAFLVIGGLIVIVVYLIVEVTSDDEEEEEEDKEENKEENKE